MLHKNVHESDSKLMGAPAHCKGTRCMLNEWIHHGPARCPCWPPSSQMRVLTDCGVIVCQLVALGLGVGEALDEVVLAHQHGVHARLLGLKIMGRRSQLCEGREGGREGQHWMRGCTAAPAWHPCAPSRPEDHSSSWPALWKEDSQQVSNTHTPMPTPPPLCPSQLCPPISLVANTPCGCPFSLVTPPSLPHFFCTG